MQIDPTLHTDVDNCKLRMFHVADHLLGPRMHIHHFAPIGRLGSPSRYCRTTDRFELARLSFREWREQVQGS